MTAKPPIYTSANYCLPKLPEELFKKIAPIVKHPKGYASDGIYGELPDGKLVEVIDIGIMMPLLENARSAQARNTLTFYGCVLTTRERVIVKVTNNRPSAGQQEFSYFDATDLIHPGEIKPQAATVG